jgi:MmyB-like transcription regulator ligand binding domain
MSGRNTDQNEPGTFLRGDVQERERNFVRLLFTDPRLRSLYPDWQGLARAVVSYLRMEAARKPDDPRLAELVGDLSIRDEQFRQCGPARTSP